MIVGGQNLVSSAPVFSHDGKKLLVCTGCTVSVFSTSTGMLVSISKLENLVLISIFFVFLLLPNLVLKENIGIIRWLIIFVLFSIQPDSF